MTGAGVIDLDMLRRAARACRNAQQQMVGDKDWFSWVPAHLDLIADRLAEALKDDEGRPVEIEPISPTEQPSPDVSRSGCQESSPPIAKKMMTAVANDPAQDS